MLIIEKFLTKETDVLLFIIIVYYYFFQKILHNLFINI
jgi:hypothetical protein